MPAFLDFSEIKKQYPILDVAKLLGIQVRPEKNNTVYRGNCPYCEKQRTFTITPQGGKDRLGISGCFKCGRTADAIGLVQNLKSFPKMPDAARFIQEAFTGKADAPEEQGLKEASRSFQSLSLQERLRKVAQDLDPDHEKLAELGISPEVATRFVAGYTGRGVARGHTITQLHDASGSLIGYVGLEDPMWLPGDIKASIANHVFNWHRIVQGPIRLLASPVEVLRTFEQSYNEETKTWDQAVCFLTPTISTVQLRYLATLMEAKGCELTPQ